MRPFLICLVAFLLPHIRAEEEPKINCRFLCLDSSPPPILTCASDSELVTEIKVSTGSISRPFACPEKSNTISFLSLSDKKPMATATIPANLKSAILIFVSASKTSPGGLPWRVFVIEDSKKNIPDGGAFVTNFHSQDIRFVVGESKIMLHLGSSKGLPRPEKRDDFNMAPVVFQFQQGDTWRNASETLLRFLPGMRYLIFAYVDPASGRPRVTTFQDAESDTVPAEAGKS